MGELLQHPWRSVGVWAAAAVACGLAAKYSASALGLSGVLYLGAVLAVAASVAVVLRAPEMGLLLMLILLPLDVAGRIVAEPVTVTWFQLALLLTLVSWAAQRMFHNAPSSHPVSPVSIGLLMLIGAAVWSLPQSISQGATAVALLRLVFQGLFYAVFVSLMRDERTVRRVVFVLVLTAIASSLLAVLQNAVPGIGIGEVHSQISEGSVLNRPKAFFSDPNYLATFLSVGIVAAVGMAVHAKRLRLIGAWLAAASISSVGLLLTYSRTGWVGALIGVGVVVLFAPKRRRRYLLIGATVLVVLASVFASGSVLSRIQSITDVDSDSSVRTRYLMIGSTQEMIEDNWVFGTGLGAFDKAYPRYRAFGAKTDITKPHQLPMVLWAEMGLPGLVSELMIVGAVVWIVWRRRRIPWNSYGAIGVAALTAVLVQSLFQYYLYFEYLWFCLALVVAAIRLDDPQREDSN